MKTTAKNLKIGDKYKYGTTIQEVTKIVKISDKAIEYRTKRISPDIYDGNFFQRKRLSTKVELISELLDTFNYDKAFERLIINQ
jgi:hypothetical protein